MPYSHLAGQPVDLDHRTLERCTCGAKVSLLKPDQQMTAMPWQCLRCGTIILASPQRREGSEFHGGIRRSDFRSIYGRAVPWLDMTPSRLSDEDIAELRNCTASTELPEHELRKSKRYAVAVPLTVVDLDERFCVKSSPKFAYSVDVSTGGMAMLHPVPTTSPLYAVEFLDNALNIPPIILRAIRCSRLGHGYAVAGDFVCRVEY